MQQETEEWRWSSASPSTWSQHEADLGLQQQQLLLQQPHGTGEWDKLDLMMRGEQQQPQQQEAEEWSALDLVLADMMRRQEVGQLGEQELIDLYHYVQHHH